MSMCSLPAFHNSNVWLVGDRSGEQDQTNQKIGYY